MEKQLFNVRKISTGKIVAGPFSNKEDAKAVRNDLDPEAAEKHPTIRGEYFDFVVTYGKDHRLYGRKDKTKAKGASRSASSRKR